MFQSGSQINAGLGRTDYSAYTQGAAQGAQAVGQGVSNLVQGVGAGIKEWFEQKKQLKKEEGAIKSASSFISQASKLTKDPEILASLNDLDKRISTGSHEERLAIASQVPNFFDSALKMKSMSDVKAQQGAEQSRQRSIEAARNALIMGKNPVGVYSPEVLDAAEVGRMEFEGKMAAKEVPEWKAFLGASDADRALMKEFKGASSSNTTVNLPPGQKKYDEIAGEALYKRQDETYKMGQKISTEIKKNNEILDLIESGKPVTGAAQSLRLWVNKAADAVFGGDKEALKSASSTEIMEALMTSMGISAASQAGVTASMMNTEKEGERIRNAFGGTASMEPESIKAMAEIRDAIYRAQMNDYNDWAASDSARMFEGSQMVKVNPLNFPSRKSREASVKQSPMVVDHNAIAAEQAKRTKAKESNAKK